MQKHKHKRLSRVFDSFWKRRQLSASTPGRPHWCRTRVVEAPRARYTLTTCLVEIRQQAARDHTWARRRQSHPETGYAGYAVGCLRRHLALIGVAGTQRRAAPRAWEPTQQEPWAQWRQLETRRSDLRGPFTRDLCWPLFPVRRIFFRSLHLPPRTPRLFCGVTGSYICEESVLFWESEPQYAAARGSRVFIETSYHRNGTLSNGSMVLYQIPSFNQLSRTQGPGIIRYVIGIVNDNLKMPFLKESDKLGCLLLWPFLAAWLSWISPRRWTYNSRKEYSYKHLWIRLIQRKNT